MLRFLVREFAMSTAYRYGLQTRVSRTMKRLVFRPQIAPMAKRRCFVFQVFQGGLVPAQVAVGPVGYGRESKAVDETLETRNTMRTSPDEIVRGGLQFRGMKR